MPQLIDLVKELTLRKIKDIIKHMLNYAVCEIAGKQYKVVPNQPLVVDYLGEGEKKLEANVLLSSDDGKIKVGNPFLKEKLTLDILENLRGEKIRVAKFHAKANYRKVRGFKSKLTKVVLTVKKA